METADFFRARIDAILTADNVVALDTSKMAA